MPLLPRARTMICAGRCLNVSFLTTTRRIMSRTLYYCEFGDPLQVVKIRDLQTMPLMSHEVLVRMLAAPVNPADINTIQGKYPVNIQLPSIPGNEGVGIVEDIGEDVDGICPGDKVIVTKPGKGRNFCLPKLPSIPGDEGVGEVVEIGNKVSTVDNGERVILTTRYLGTWRYYGIYDERDVHVISPHIPLPEASMLAVAPCAAYRMIRDFRKLTEGDTVIQNAANSAYGQCVIQLCKAWNINTFNIVANNSSYKSIKKYLLDIGATAVYNLEEAEELTLFNTSLTKPVLALNCLGGRFEDVVLKLLEQNGTIVYYGSAFDVPIAKHVLRPDVYFNRFHLCEWDTRASVLEKDIMMNNITKLMILGKLRAPLYQPIEMKNYIYALKNTNTCEAFSNMNYVFDLTLP